LHLGRRVFELRVQVRVGHQRAKVGLGRIQQRRWRRWRRQRGYKAQSKSEGRALTLDLSSTHCHWSACSKGLTCRSAFRVFEFELVQMDHPPALRALRRSSVGNFCRIWKQRTCSRRRSEFRAISALGSMCNVSARTLTFEQLERVVQAVIRSCSR
jgi:hypothetical protein